MLDLLGRHGAVALLAGHGWGKSTLAGAIAAEFDGAVAGARCGDLVQGGLAEAVDRLRAEGGPALLVVDDAECLASDVDAIALLAELTEAPGRDGIALLLCTSEPIGELLAGDAFDEDGIGTRIPVLTPRDLRFSMGEVEGMRARSAATSPLPATDVLRLTGGWPRGVREAVQLEARNPRILDLLDDAIESSVLTALTSTERHFLLRVAALAPVDRAAAIAVLGRDVNDSWRAVDRKQLPLVTVDAEQISMRRPLLDYFRSELARELPGATQRLRADYLAYLRSMGRLVEVVDWHLDRGSRSEALDLIAEYVRTGADVDMAEPAFERWIKALGLDALLANDDSAGMMIRILHRRQQTEQAAMLAQQLIDDDRMDSMLEADPDLRPVVMYVLHNRPQVALQLLPEARGSHALGAFAYSVAATGDTEPVEPPDRSEWGDLAIHVLWGMIWQGRLADAIDSVTEGRTITDANASLVLAALWSDRTELADDAYRQVPKGDGYPWAQFAQAAIALYRSEFDKGLRILGNAMPSAQRTQAAPTFETLASYLVLKSGDAGRAIRSVEARLPQHLSSGRHAIAEWSQVILALSYLDRERPEEAAQVLEAAIPAMEQAERLLLLATARIAYAETQARTGASTAVLRQLLEAAVTAPAGIGSPYWEREARSYGRELRRLGLIADGAGVAGSSASDAGRGAEPRSERLGVAAVPQQHSGRLSAYEKPPVLELDGVSHPLGRTKLAELVADLAVRGGVVDRAGLQVRLFPDVGQRSAGNHFRQVLFKLRELTGVVLDRPSRSEIGWPSPETLTSSDLEFEGRMRPLLADDQADVEALRASLDVMSGPYLPASELAWVSERRQLLNLLFEEGVARMLRHPAAVDDLDLIRDYGHRAVLLSPYSEEIYRLMIEAELDRGSAARARAVYGRAVDAMQDLGLEPSGEIQILARRLRERSSPERVTREAPPLE